MSLRAALLKPTTVARTSLVSRRYAGGGPHLNEPTGYIFGEKPPPPGEKRKRQSWELPYIYLFGGSMVVFGFAYAYKPNTSMSAWAREEAIKRMEARGDLPKYVPTHPTGNQVQ